MSPLNAPAERPELSAPLVHLASMSTAEQFTITPRGPFSLAASIRFLEGFAPAGYAGADQPVLRVAFPVEGGWTPVGVEVRQGGDGVVHARVFPAGAAPDREAVRAPRRRSRDTASTCIRSRTT